MRRSFLIPSGRFDVLTGDEFLRFHDIEAAVSFLKDAKSNTLHMQELRHLLRDSHQDLSRLTDDEVLRQFGRLLVNGRIRVLRPFIAPARSTAGGGAAAVSEKKAPAASPAASRGSLPRRTWVEFRVIDDETGAPVAGVELTIMLSDGSVETRATDAGGYVEINDCPKGACALTCDFSSAQLATSYVFVRNG